MNNIDRQSEKSEAEAHGSAFAFLALAGVLEIGLLVIAVIVTGVAYTVGLHLAVLLFAIIVAAFGFWKWRAKRK